MLVPPTGDNPKSGEKTMEKKINPAYLSVTEAESWSGISKWTWRRWAYEGRVASVKLGKRLVIPVAEIQRLVNEGTRPRIEEQ
jgi:hypothetical protein